MSTDKGDGEQDFGGPLSNLQVRGHRSEVGDREQGDRDSKICHLGGWQVRGSCNVFQPSMKNYRAFPEARVLALGPHGMWAVAVQRQDLKERAFRLASRVFKLFPELASTGLAHAYLARQLLSATASVGANLEEGVAASSRRDMASKYSIALRESREAKYWSRLLAVDPRWTARAAQITRETDEFVAMLTVSVKKLRQPAQTQSALRVGGKLRRSRRIRPRRRG